MNRPEISIISGTVFLVTLWTFRLQLFEITTRTIWLRSKSLYTIGNRCSRAQIEPPLLAGLIGIDFSSNSLDPRIRPWFIAGNEFSDDSQPASLDFFRLYPSRLTQPLPPIENSLNTFEPTKTLPNYNDIICSFDSGSSVGVSFSSPVLEQVEDMDISNVKYTFNSMKDEEADKSPSEIPPGRVPKPAPSESPTGKSDDGSSSAYPGGYGSLHEDGHGYVGHGSCDARMLIREILLVTAMVVGLLLFLIVVVGYGIGWTLLIKPMFEITGKPVIRTPSGHRITVDIDSGRDSEPRTPTITTVQQQEQGEEPMAEAQVIPNVLAHADPLVHDNPIVGNEVLPEAPVIEVFHE